jgi:hypothetical protein
MDEDRRHGLSNRLCLLADVDNDGFLNEHEFALMWRHLPTCCTVNLLNERFGSRYTAPADLFIYGSREDWLGGLQTKLGALVRRSVEAECTTNDGGKWREQYHYFVSQPAKPTRRPEDGEDAHGVPIIFDEGHVRTLNTRTRLAVRTAYPPVHAAG